MFIRKKLFTGKLLLGVVIVISMITVFGTIHNSIASNATTTAEEAATATSASETVVKVAAGGGNATAPWTVFLPQEVKINAGDSVMWYNPTEGAAEPHTVTFVLDNSTMAGVESPLIVSNTTEFTAIPPGSNNEPILIPSEGGMNTLIAINARTYNPATIDSQDKVQFASPNANYSMTGDEKYINSGWFLPKGLEQEYPGSGNTFTLTFEKPGTYAYLCVLHPWMTGSVVVEE